MRSARLSACLAATLILATASIPAQAATTVCKNRNEIIEILSRKFGETQRSFGLQNNKRILELYASPNGSWTALITLPSGRSCVLGAGEAWTVVPPQPVGEPA
ncbi:hypothetical protein L1787_12660 [Acuticoccus sp. M5D2P5]|uniref:hypothetical protein n=1 Tax=Acuticoccus kalidii TaxID=2910977 RepID=UPI001F33B1C4|nr:hypothetical protein [Acuticoccus kalidii]MCF3934260.1 hypothetical protein [Acuticoccus kalidii]